jgi:hypothetical protein
MAAADRSGPSTAAASDVAGACREAGLVRLVGTADGDALAAVGVLARALGETGVAFQASVAPAPRVASETDADVTVTFGVEGGDLSLTDSVLSVPAYEAARELGATVDPALALAGVVAAGERPDAVGGPLADAAPDRRPGIATPVADPTDALAHSTLFHAPFSGDVAAARTALEEGDLDGDALDENGRELASLVALSVASEGTTRAATAVERALHPHVGGPFRTVGGFADVLDAVARERPGVGVALALGHDADEAALSAWRAHAERAHTALTAEFGRYDGLSFVRAGPVGTVARLARDFRSPEPAALAVEDREAAIAVTTGSAVRSLRAALSAVEAADETTVTGRGTTAYARLDAEIDERELARALGGEL